MGVAAGRGEDPRAWYDAVYGEREAVVHTFKLKLLELALPHLPGRAVLDVGCGSGAMTALLAKAGARVTAVDFSEAGLDQVQGAEAAHQVDLDRAPLPFPDGGFDAVWFTEVLEHLVSPVAALRELRRVLRPGGHLFLSTPNSAFWVYRAAGLVGIPPSELQHPGHVQFFSERSLRAALAEAGFTCEAMLGRGVYALLPAPWRKDKAPPAAPEGLIYQDTLTRGSVLMYTRFTRRWISLVADTLMVVARA